METKSLYTILGVRPDASSDQIESTYAEILHHLKDGSESNPGGDDRIRLIAAKEAYDVLSNPAARQRYNQKLFAPEAIEAPPTIIIEPDTSWSVAKLLTIGLIVVAAIWLYSHFSVERERMLIEHDKEIADRQNQLEQARQQQQDANQQARQEAQLQMQRDAQERAIREAAIRDSRELDYRMQQDAREAQQQQQREAREKQQALREAQYQQQQADARQRQMKLDAERQIEREKRALRDLQNPNGNSRYY